MVIRPTEILEEALARAEGMSSFFALIGQAIRSGRSSVALEALRGLGLERVRAWQMVEGWEGTERRERQTGWTAEVAAMGCVMNDLDDWAAFDWRALGRRLLDLTGRAPEGGEPPTTPP